MKNIRSRKSGYVLLEVMLALAIFSIAVVGMASALNEMIDIVVELRRDREVQLQLQSYVSETKARQLSELEAIEILNNPDDPILYEREVKVLEWETSRGERLAGMYQVTVRASKNKVNEAKLLEEITYYAYQP